MPQQQQSWPRAVLFDFDGVIVNSEPLHFFAMQEALASEKIELTEDEYYRELIGFDDRGAFRNVYQRRGKTLEPKTLLALITHKSERMMDLIRRRRFHALPGVEEFVRALWRHVPLAICSGGLREEIEAMLEGVALRDCFQFIVAAEDVTVGKPDPQGYLLCVRRINDRWAEQAHGPPRRPLKPAECLVVEDAPTVISAVKSVGFPTLAVASSYPLMKLAEADWAVKGLGIGEVLEQVPGLGWAVGEPA
jgi:beta-phosphoglucomutase-like phosphatase (HAD superfamily)